MLIPEIIKSENVTELQNEVLQIHEYSNKLFDDYCKLQKELSKLVAEKKQGALIERIEEHIKNEADDMVLHELINPLKHFTNILSYIQIEELDKDFQEATRDDKIFSIMSLLKHMQDHITYTLQVLNRIL